MANLSELPPADQEAIGKTLLTLLKAFDDRDAKPLRGVYCADADWVNASALSSADATKSSTTSPCCSETTTSTAASSPVRRR